MGNHLTYTQVRVLRNIRDHDNAAWDFSGLAQHGGVASSVAALRRRGLVTGNPLTAMLTEAGRKALEDAEDNK